MKILDVGSNMTELQLNNGTSVLFSYSTPVACSTVDGWFKTEQWYSTTTTKHVNKWLKVPKSFGIKAQTKPQEFFNNLVAD
jgi:hypothetical protein